MEERVIELEKYIRESLVDYANSSGLGWSFSSYTTKSNKDDSTYLIFIRKKIKNQSPRRLSITVVEGINDIVIRRNIMGVLYEDTVDINDRLKIFEIGVNWIIGLLSEPSEHVID